MSEIHSVEDISLYLSHGFINCLFAGYQGKYSAQNILQQLDRNKELLPITKKAGPDDLELSKSILDTINVWGMELWEGKRLVNPHSVLPPSQDARYALDLLNLLQSDLEVHVMNTIDALRSEQGPEQKASEYLIACFGRYAYGKDNYIKGLVQYGKKCGADDVVEQWTPQLTICTEDIKLANYFFYSYLRDGAKLQTGFFEDLHESCEVMPLIFREQISDISQILELYVESYGANAEVH